MTLVAVDKNGRPATSGILKLADPTDPEFPERMEQWAHQRKTLNARWAQLQAAVNALPFVSRSMLDTASTSGDDASLEVEDAVVEFATVFVPKHLNGHGTVYGGELLHWMVRLELTQYMVGFIHLASIVNAGQNGRLLCAELHTE